MTIQTVMTMTEAQRHYLRAAISCLLAVQGEAATRTRSLGFSDIFCAGLRDDVLALATDDGRVSPLDHQDGQELLELLELADGIELRATEGPKVSGIKPFYDVAPGTYTDQVGADEEAWKIPCMLTVTGAETEDAAAVLADTFLGRAMMDATVNADEVVLGFEVDHEATYAPAPVPAPGIYEAHLG